MKNFNRGQGEGGQRSGGFGGRRNTGDFERRGSRDSGGRGGFRRDSQGGSGRTMTKAVCADCGQSCEVPFKPIGGKPVFCSNCFKGKDSSRPAQSHDRSFSKPDFSSQPYSRPETTSRDNHVSNDEQFKKLETKLDKIISLLELAAKKPEVVFEKEEKSEEVAPVKLSKIKKPVNKVKTKSVKPKAAVKKAKGKK